MTRYFPLLAGIAALALSGCATTGATRGPTEVTRYHLGQPIAPGSVAVEPAGLGAGGPEAQLYADAVAGELSRLGYSPQPMGADAQYVAAVTFSRNLRGQVRTPPKFSIGIGGGGFDGGRRGGGVGLGGGVSTGFGSKTRDIIGNELAVQLRRRSDGTVIWEGRAQNTGLSGCPDAQPNATAARMAAALFKGFPGESGISISVP